MSKVFRATMVLMAATVALGLAVSAVSLALQGQQASPEPGESEDLPGFRALRARPGPPERLVRVVR